jgi:hypothetical protein
MLRRVGKRGSNCLTCENISRSSSLGRLRRRFSRKDRLCAIMNDGSDDSEARGLEFAVLDAFWAVLLLAGRTDQIN